MFWGTKIGKKTEASENEIGNHGLGIRNIVTERPIGDLDQQDLHAINTYFNKKTNRK